MAMGWVDGIADSTMAMGMLDYDGNGDARFRRYDQVNAAKEPALDTMLNLGKLVLGFYSDNLTSPCACIYTGVVLCVTRQIQIEFI
jgi:hypothetical protein